MLNTTFKRTFKRTFTFLYFACFFVCFRSNFGFASESAPHSKANHNNQEKHSWKPLYKVKTPDKKLSTRPGQIEIVTPEWFSTTDGTVTLKWTASDGADAYYFQAATDANFKWLVKSEPLLRATEYTLKNLESGQFYYWRVAGIKTNNDASYLKGEFSKSMFQIK